MDTLRILTLDEVRAHCNVDYEEDDALLTAYGSAAEESVLRQTRRTAAELVALGGGTFPVQLRLAMAMLAATWYRLREAASGVDQHAVPYAVDFLVKPYVMLTGTEREYDPWDGYPGGASGETESGTGETEEETAG